MINNLNKCAWWWDELCSRAWADRVFIQTWGNRIFITDDIDEFELDIISFMGINYANGSVKHSYNFVDFAIKDWYKGMGDNPVKLFWEQTLRVFSGTIGVNKEKRC